MRKQQHGRSAVAVLVAMTLWGAGGCYVPVEEAPTGVELPEPYDAESVSGETEDLDVAFSIASHQEALKDDPANRPRRAATFWTSYYMDVLRKCLAGPEYCDGHDNNCNGKVDEGC